MAFARETMELQRKYNQYASLQAESIVFAPNPPQVKARTYRKWYVRFRDGYFAFGTPWFYVAVADPDGAYSVVQNCLISGVFVGWGRNPDERGLPWLHYRRFCERVVRYL